MGLADERLRNGPHIPTKCVSSYSKHLIAVRRESRRVASHEALSRQASESAARRGKQKRKQAVVKAAPTQRAA